jgi:general secretion pathway protein C
LRNANQSVSLSTTGLRLGWHENRLRALTMPAAVSTPSIKTCFALMPFGLGVIAVHLQASAINQLVAAAIAAPRVFVPLPSLPKTPDTATRHSGGAKAILMRNVFDSTTGPIDPTPGSTNRAASPTDPLSAISCQGTKTLIVTESTDPAWSSATLQGKGDATPMLRRVGDIVTGRQVAFIGYNPKYQQPSVWLAAGAELCQSPLFAAPAPIAETAGSSPELSGVNASRRDRPTQAQPQTARGRWFQSLRIVPEARDGRIIGFRLSGIQRGSLLGLLGLRSGDVIETINGNRIANAETALQAYVRLRTAERLKVQLVREGQTMTIDYRIL